MGTTSNYSLKKPAPTDNYNIQDHNDNMDIIDAALKANSDTISTKETPAGAQAKADAVQANLTTHLADAMPHKFTEGATVYKWGLCAIDGVVMFNYEEVV